MWTTKTTINTLLFKSPLTSYKIHFRQCRHLMSSAELLSIQFAAIYAPLEASDLHLKVRQAFHHLKGMIPRRQIFVPKTKTERKRKKKIPSKSESFKCVMGT